MSLLWLSPIVSMTLFVAASRSHNLAPNTTFLDIKGHIRLGALFPIHKQGSGPGRPCGEIQKEDGIQPLEAMLFTLDEINRDEKLLPGIDLGMKSFDSCDNPYYAAERSLALLQGFITRETNLTCSVMTENGGEDWPCWDNIVGLIGPQTSPVSVQIANLGRLFHVPQVSYLSTSVKLCNQEQFPYFFRTVPSDVHQAKAIVELLREFGWEYASIVHSDSEYGETGYLALKKHVSMVSSICLADPITIHNLHFTMEDYKGIIRALLKNAMSRVVIVFADRVPAGKLLEAAKIMSVKDKFVWIGSDAWASRESVVEDREEIVEGAIAVQPLRRELPGYNKYFTRLIETPNSRNPWFEEYLHRYHNCSNDPSHAEYPHCNESRASGGGNNPFKYSQQLYIHFVRDAVYAFAHALHNLHEDSCGGFRRRLCPEFKTRVFTDLRSYLRDVSFPDVARMPFKFSGKGTHDGPPRYSIINFQKNEESGLFDWRNVGTFHETTFSEWDASFRTRFQQDMTITHCQRQRCNQSSVIVQNTEDLCCWHCRPCSSYEFKASDYECKECPRGTRSDNLNRTGCVIIEETYLDYTNKWAIGALSFASVGIFMTVVTCFIMWFYWETPVVKASGRELSLLLLFGTFLSFLTTYAIVAKPTDVTCGIMRFCIGFCYTVCYAAIVTKTNRVSRIFAARTQPRFTSPRHSLLIASGLISVEVVINVIWLLCEPPTTTHLVGNVDKRILVCSGAEDSFMTGLVYPFILLLCATVYAFRTRKCPDGFNETRFIFFTNSINSIHWIAYVPLYFVSTDPEIRGVILAFSLSLSGVLHLACLLFPRVYLVLFKPEKNTRGDVMTKKHARHSFNMPETPPNSAVVVHGGGGGTEILMTQVSCMSAPAPAAMQGSGARLADMEHISNSSGQIPVHIQENSLSRVVVNKPLSAAMRDRQMTWSFHSQKSGRGGGFEDPAAGSRGNLAPSNRTRSSSVCKGTQTIPSKETSEKKIKFTVSEASDSSGNDDEEEEEEDTSSQKTNNSEKTQEENANNLLTPPRAAKR